MQKYKKIAFLFPGQGAQYPGMAKEFVENHALAKETFQEADEILGRKISDIILNGPEKTLTETRNSQTGIYVASLAMLRVIQKLFPNLKPSVTAGLSLGEYTALTASDRLPFKPGLNLVQNRGQFMNDACEANKGTMAVIIGLEGPVVEQLVREVNLPNDLWAANFNCPGQVVLSGTVKGIQVGTDAAKAKGAKMVIPLQVHGAFHSGLMKQAEERLKEHIEQAPLVDSSIGLVMNVPGDFVSAIPEIRNNLIKQVTSPVRWEQGIRAMANAGVDLFVEIGPGKTLTGFIKKIPFPVPIPSISIEKVKDLELLSKD